MEAAEARRAPDVNGGSLPPIPERQSLPQGVFILAACNTG